MFKQSEKEEAELDRVLNLMNQPYNIDSARKLIIETNQVMEANHVKFFLRQGTCLGAVRDGDLLPWDDDIDIGSIYGLHGFSEDMIDPVTLDMRKHNFLVRFTLQNDFCKCVTFVKESMRIDWACYWVIDDSIIMYPAIPIPITLFINLKEIELLGEKFLVPNPPEDYLQSKYGEDWRTPKLAGEYEGEVLNIISDTYPSDRSSTFRQLLMKILPWRFATKVHLIDQERNPLTGANLFIAGIGNFKSNKHGIVNFYLPRSDYYALRIEENGQSYILYIETLDPGEHYVYQLGAEHLFTTSDEMLL